jgi:precorrin-2 dehydrogenase / sirohydrochlorin ferrochelatase
VSEHYIACLDLTGRRCVLIGEAPQKAEALRAAGADVVVASKYEPSLLDGAWLVVCVDRSQGERVFADAGARRIFCNVEDVPELCTFILPALHRRGPITVAVSTGGASPALAQWIRGKVAELVGPEHARLAERLRSLRPWAKANLATYEERRDYFQEIVRKELA